MTESEKKETTVSSDLYEEDYYLEFMAGHDAFDDSTGSVHHRFEDAFELAPIRSDDLVLDIGCGRGEIAFLAASQNASVFAIDYADAALRIARQSLNEKWPETAPSICFAKANGKTLPFLDNMFDKIYLLDVVEHLYPDELKAVLSEAHRVLKKDGKLIVHTAPNKLYASIGYRYQKMITTILYPIAQLIFRRDIRIQANPRGEFSKHFHVNEQTILSMSKTLAETGFNAKVTPKGIPPLNKTFERLLWNVIVYLWPVSYLPILRDIFSIGIWAVAVKR